MTIKEDFIKYFGKPIDKRRTKKVLGVYLEYCDYLDEVFQIVDNIHFFYLPDIFDDEMNYQGDSLKQTNAGGYNELLQSIEKIKEICRMISIEKLEEQMNKDLNDVVHCERTLIKF
ncbi:hypothetical protein [Comamonas terrigena]|uniref:hypothetical protein n=1 Tax=Comamonas terrigena TaxID=32013 RepID=UPI0028ABF84F|nr:hypothetical protein [Comamonas terrigena]